MAQKIILGKRPKDFNKTIEFKMLDGSDGCIPAKYKYRTRKELAKLTDEIQATAQAQAEVDVEAFKAKIEKNEEIEPLKQIDIVERDISLQVDYLLQALDGWGLDAAFDRAAVEQLADEVPAAIPALIDGYREAINKGRLGN
jgi:hypothetical protein